MDYDDPHDARWTLSWKLWVTVQVITCRGRGIFWRPNYRPHSLLSWGCGLLFDGNLLASAKVTVKTIGLLFYWTRWSLCLFSMIQYFIIRPLPSISFIKVLFSVQFNSFCALTWSGDRKDIRPLKYLVVAIQKFFSLFDLEDLVWSQGK